MKYLVGLGVLLVLGLAAIVVSHDGSSGATSAVVSQAEVATVTHGDAVDIDKVVPAEGYVIVEFYADW